MTLAPHYPTRYLRPKVATHFQNSTKQTDRLTVICFVLTTRKPRWLGITSICPTTCWLPCKVAGSIPCAGLCQRLPEYLHHAVQACVLAGSPLGWALWPMQVRWRCVCVCVCVCSNLAFCHVPSVAFVFEDGLLAIVNAIKQWQSFCK